MHIYINMKTINDQEVRYCTAYFWSKHGSSWRDQISLVSFSFKTHGELNGSSFFQQHLKFLVPFMGLDWLDVSRIRNGYWCYCDMWLLWDGEELQCFQTGESLTWSVLAPGGLEASLGALGWCQWFLHIKWWPLTQDDRCIIYNYDHK